MALYQVLQKSYINGRIYEEGETVELDDSIEVADNLQSDTSKPAKTKPAG